MEPDEEGEAGWSHVDIASILNGKLDRHDGYPDNSFTVSLSGGDHPGEGEYVVDPDYFDILGMSDPSELIKRKTDISR